MRRRKLRGCPACNPLPYGMKTLLDIRVIAPNISETVFSPLNS